MFDWNTVDAELAPRRVAGGPLTLAPASYVVVVVEGRGLGLVWGKFSFVAYLRSGERPCLG